MGWRRAVRRVLAWSAGPPLVVVAGIIGATLALLYTPPGRALTARAVTDFITARVAGEVTIGGIRGNIIRHVVLDSVVIRDSTGAVLLDASRVEARYLLPELLAGRLHFSQLVVERPVVHLVRLPEGRWNYQAIFRSGTDTIAGGSPPLVRFEDVTIRSGTVRVDVPTTTGPPRQPISSHGAEPAQAEVVESDHGPMRVYRLAELQAELPSVRVSTPADDPIRVEIARLSGVLSDPAMRIADVQGELITAADSLRFRLDRAALPATRVQGEGAVRWPDDTIRYDFRLTADTVALADLRWVQPDFPDWVGHGSVTALSTSDRHTEFRLTNLELGRGPARAAGRVVAIVDEDRGFGVRDLDMVLRDVPLEVMRPYLDTLPFRGALTGRLRADGYKSLLSLGGQLAFLDAIPPGSPTSTFSFDGDVGFGGDAGATFRGFTLHEALVDLGTVRVLVPAVELPGRLRLVGTLNGPWQDAAFTGTAEHLAPNNALSRLTGSIRMDTRSDILGLAMDARFDRLSFDALRTGYPQLTARGGLTGHVVTSGYLDSLQVDAEVTGDVGTIGAHGVIGIDSARLRFDDMALELHRVNVEALLGTGQETALNGTMSVTGVIDSGVPPRGTVGLTLGQSRIGGFTIDNLSGTLRSDGRLLALDSLHAGWATGRVLANGRLGWAAPDSGRVDIDAAGFSLTNFDSLARATLSLAADTTHPHQLDGLARARITLRGSLERLAVDGVVDAEDLVLDDWRVAVLSARIGADSLSATGLHIAATADSVSHGEYLGRDVKLVVGGTADSMEFAGSGRLREARLAAGGWRVRDSSATRLGLDSLRLDFPHQHWSLLEPLRATMTDRRLALDDTVRVATSDGGGAIELSGAMPGDGEGELAVSVVGLNLGDIYAALERDTTAVGGIASADFRLGGTRAAPTLRGNGMVAGPRFGEAEPPLVRAAYDYRDQTLRANLTFWKLGEPVLEVDASVPYDLALETRRTRTLAGPIRIRATADSADLGIIEAFTESIRYTRGWLALDLGVGGTWQDPRLDGTMAIHAGRMTLPSLGVRYGPILGSARFTGDSMVIDTLLLSSGEGDLIVKGAVRFEELSRAVLALQLNSQGFLAMDVPGFMRLRPTGTVTLTGPVFNAVMRSNGVTLNDSDIYFADLLNKDVIDLQNPAYADLVDPEELRRDKIGVAFQNRFLDSLRIENTRFTVGTDVWLRSSGTTNIQLEGAAQVSKRGRNYRVAGELNTPRGDYQLQVGGILNRTFNVDRGTVRYVGTPDLNAELDIQASYTVHASDGDEIPIVATITGTIEVPKVQLASPGRSIPERDLVSYLIFGRPEFQVTTGTAGGDQLKSQMIETALAAVSGEAGRTLGQMVGLDLFEIRPMVALGGASGLSLAAGVQLGPRWFVTLNAGFCIGGAETQNLSARNFGATIEYRFAREWRLQTSAEPVQGCGNHLSDAFNTIPRRYQFGADILWSRDY